ncbi:hypothetical protein D9619_013249 [Psilocybe cf. subviscida]|uniref:Uncharacterized protein n=1 Tax=Psilocybe cf. subviscida TaxID=2480587 RepID=A0A8H5BSD9_9AGAR|nr:hypothetical protein D9619_013249 [Psilocybe cf. subviscida]
MTTFAYFDLEQTVRGNMVDLPTFETYNVQYQSPTSGVHYEPTSHQDAVYKSTSLQHFGFSPGGNGSPSFSSDHSQSSVQGSRFWENGIASGGTFEGTAYAATCTSSTVGIPASVAQWHADYLHSSDGHIQASMINPPPLLDPFQMSTCATHEMDGLSAAQMPPEALYIPTQLVPSFRHTMIPHPSAPSIGTAADPAMIQVAAHQPVPPECQSTYSTLAGNIEFLEKLRLDSGSRNPCSRRASPSFAESPCWPVAASSSSSFKRPRSPSSTALSYPQTENGTRQVAFLDERSTKGSLSGAVDPSPDVPDTWIPTQLMFVDRDSGRGASGSNSAKRARMGDSSSPSSSLLSQSSPSSPAVTSKSASGLSAVTIEEAPPVTKHPKNVKEPRKPSLACLFCRERKIGCGRPPEGSEDMTCK